ncbi:ras guanine nucleotide exchange factor B [Toxorhynchites rutilus septentrionalis]|uniref:ras guanine nucleotide exchange factor B n=1 Tax=Toxorhynchites rutilus septentrionalis TaxID=329112 RepID=UPI00247876D4|nr:ras guanine nucleotide exchange factor B [Toxorhynchites rutilus septentrionalis]XP_055645063.1 ras guanine nucleotide exchange factor B [Toxorhynchites rutilus septentrionalis]XP_055645065.1 ras guanine nucleotide exchange factor B [Toxorhynchites rutilus septentrionalis]XP_055645066.1 ras guanine nucleotide exchange factor B [Toxorhynchites rutilus septentrionalis]XP_055645067.1 ras guanine nucleotide exchange factor B [Toxorhynchites rutilus septentrionalis]XP_055645068.1 ras guanine nuc
MSPERHPSHDGGDGEGEGGGGAIIGGQVTVETSTPKSSPIITIGQLDATSSSTGSSMVLSSMPVEANKLILQQHLAHQPQPQQQQQHHIITTSNTNQNHNNSNGSAISATSSGSSNHSIIINNNTSFKNHNNNNIIISGSGVSGANSNNHTYTINLSSSHNGHAVIANGGAVPIQSYAPIVSTNNSSSSSITASAGNHSHHHLGQQQQHFHHLHPASNGTTIINPNMTTVHSNGLTTATTTVMASSAVPASSPLSSGPTSKLVVLQQGHLGENYITTTDGMNGVGNIVLLATEQMDMSGTEHDIINNNVVITSSSNCYSNHNGGGGQIGSSVIGASNHQYTIRNGTTSNGVVVNADEELTPLTWLHDKNLLKGINLSKVPVSSPDSPRQAGGHLSPTSDFVEDSSVSEDNTSSANSSSEQSIGVYCTETAHPIGRPLPITATTHHHTFQLSNGGHKTITTINGDTIIEYPMVASDEKELKSPSSTVSCASSSSSSSTSSSLYSSSPSPNPTSALSSHNGSNSGASTPHQHFHKKYLREEHVKQLKQGSNSYVTPVKQHTSTIKYEESELCDERNYPQASIKNGYNSSEEYSGGPYGGGMKPPSPPLSPHQMHSAGSISGIHELPQQPSLSPQPSPVSNGGQQQSKLSPPKAKHPTNLPYDPQVHVHSKPPFSFSSLIFMAIENCQQKALPVKEIYAWIVQHFPYFKTAPTGWKNSVRHNLSLNKCFQKVEKAANLGKGSLWMVEPQYRPNLIQALSRSPFHSGSGIDKTTYKAMQQQAQQQAQQQQHQRSTDSPTSSIGSSYSKDNFPYLASRLTPIDPQNGVHLHHLHQQQHPDLDGDDFSRSSTPIDYDGGDLPQHHPAVPGTYHVTYHHHSGGGGGGGGNGVGSGLGTMVSPAGAIANGYTTGGHVGNSGSLTAGRSVPTGETGTRDWSADTIEDVNAATAMLALKHGPKIFTDGGFQNGTNPVITTSPSEDHTYSAGDPTTASGRSSQNNSDNNSNETLSDAAYESSEESQNPQASEELEEQRRQAGVDALLNLAGITNYSSTTIQSISSSLKRPASSVFEADRQSPYHHHHQQQQQRLESTPPSGYSIVVQQQQQQQSYRDSYYAPDDLSQYSSPSPPKKSKSSSSSRMLKKFKKKASWVR